MCRACPGTEHGLEMQQDLRFSWGLVESTRLAAQEINNVVQTAPLCDFCPGRAGTGVIPSSAPSNLPMPPHSAELSPITGRDGRGQERLCLGAGSCLSCPQSGCHGPDSSPVSHLSPGAPALPSYLSSCPTLQPMGSYSSVCAAFQPPT